MKARRVIKNIIKYMALFGFILGSALTQIFSAVPADASAEQSNIFTRILMIFLNNNHDKQTIKELKDFKVTLEDENHNTWEEGKTFSVGETFKYRVDYTPVDTSYKELDVTYNEEFLSRNGNAFKVLRDGQTSITFQSVHYRTFIKTIDLTLVNVEVDSVSFVENGTPIDKEKPVTLNIGDQHQTHVQILPENATNKTISYSSSDPRVCSVDEVGVVTANGEGDAMITVTSNNGKTDTYPFRVNAKEELVIKTDSLKFTTTTLSAFEKNNSYSVKGTYTPSNATDFASSNIKITVSDEIKPYLNTPTISGNGGNFNLSLKTNGTAVPSDKQGTITLEINGNVSNALSVTIHPRKNLSAEIITNMQTESKTVNRRTVGYDFVNDPISESIDDFIYADSVSWKINYNSTFKREEYNTNSFDYTYPSDVFTKKTSTYNSLVFAPKLDMLEMNKVYNFRFIPDKSDTSKYFELNVTYQDAEKQTTYIRSIGLNNFENKELYVDSDYESCFAETIDCSPSNSIFKNSEITYVQNAGTEEYYEFITSSTGKVTGIKTKKATPSGVTVGFTMQIHVSATNKVHLAEKDVSYSFKIVDEPTKFNFRLTKSGSPIEFAETIDLDKSESVSVAIDAVHAQSIGNSTFNIDCPVSLEFSVDNGDSLTYSLNADKRGATFTAIDKSDIDPIIHLKATLDLNKNIYLNETFRIHITYRPIDPTLFKFELKNPTDCDEFNMPTDYSKVAKGTTFEIHPTVDENASNRSFNITSDDSTILKIGASKDPYTCTALKVGEATITMTSSDDNSIKYEKKIQVVHTSSPIELDLENMNCLEFSTVKDPNTDKISYYKMQIDFGKSYQFKLTNTNKASSTNFRFEEMDMTDQALNNEVISVDKVGTITTTEVGTTWFKISYGNEDAIHTYSLYVQVEVIRYKVPAFSKLSYLVRKSLGHFSLFALTSLCMVVFLFLQFKKPWHQAVALGCNAAFGFLLAYCSELVQKYTPGRCMTWEDIGIDYLGYVAPIIVGLIGIGIFLLICFFIDLYKKKHASVATAEEIPAAVESEQDSESEQTEETKQNGEIQEQNDIMEEE